MKDKELLRLLLKDGWRVTKIRGSHHHLFKNGKREIIPVHGKEIKKGLLSAILKNTGLCIGKPKKGK